MRILIASLVSPNLIDGSSIWLASLIECLALSREISLTVPLAARVERREVLGHLLNHPRVQFIEPGFALQELFRKRMSPRRMLNMVIELDRRERQDLFLVRGPKILELIADRPHLARRTWGYLDEPGHFLEPGRLERLRKITSACKRLLCQTDRARSFLHELLGEQEDSGIELLPPMIPRVRDSEREPPDARRPRLGYAGKFSPPYRIEQMLKAFGRIRDAYPEAEFHVVGDKFHNAPRVEGFEERVRAGLESAPGVTWHSGLSREDTLKLLDRVDLAASWRDDSFDSSRELSTKVLEYSGLGVPTLLNPTPVQKDLLGDDYPGYVSSEDEFVERFGQLVGDQELYLRTSQALQKLAGEYTFEKTLARMLPLLQNDVEETRRKAAQRKQAKTILFAGHDLKFARHLLDCFEASDEYRILVDKWKGHQRTNLLRSLSLVKQADVIFCEWCLGNAVWYARVKQPHQKLIVRLHLQELDLPFLDEIPLEKVDRLVTVCPRNLEILKSRFPQAADRFKVIHNMVDCDELDRDKHEGARFNLGLVGTAPRRKNPKMALDIFERLRDTDPRYNLHIKGKDPLSYPWLRKRPEEVAYYQEFNIQVENSKHGANVFFTPWGDDMPEFYSRTGFILSTSDLESFHLVLAEGMAAGCIPLIRDWPGARDLYSPEWIFKSPDEAVALMKDLASDEAFREASRRAKEEVRSKFSKDDILEKYKSLVAGLLAEGD